MPAYSPEIDLAFFRSLLNAPASALLPNKLPSSSENIINSSGWRVTIFSLFPLFPVQK
jgi:hypothetical protein